MSESHIQSVDAVEAVTEAGVGAPHAIDCGGTEGHEQRLVGGTG